MRSLAVDSLAALIVPSAAAAQRSSLAETPASDVVQWLGLQEEVYPQPRGDLQWRLGTGIREETDQAISASWVGLELGVVEGLEVQGDMQLAVGLDSGETGLGQGSLGLVYGPIDEENGGLSFFVETWFPARSGLGDDSYAHDVSAIAHYSIDRVHAQVLGGLEVQHGDDLRSQRAQDVRVDPRGAVALWVHLDTLAIIVEGAADPEPGGMRWKLGPTLSWRAIRDLVLVGNATASFGDERPLWSGVVGAIFETELFR